MTHAYAAVITTSPDSWLLLIVSLPTARTTARTRIWHAIKVIDCTVLRDGVYLLPVRAEHATQLNELADKTLRENDQAWVLCVQAAGAAGDTAYRTLFGRTPNYAEWLAELSEARKTLPDLSTAGRNRLLYRYTRVCEAIRKIDFFSNEATVRAGAQWRDFAAAVEATHSSGESRAAAGGIPRHDPTQHRGHLQTARRHLWVDRVASAWLIQRFTDPHARFLWFDNPADYPAEALGLDFDGATFMHVGERASFEVLIVNFRLNDNPGLARLGAMVYALDVGGVTTPEADGFETTLAGARKRLADDDALLIEISTVLDSLYMYFSGSRRT